MENLIQIIDKLKQPELRMLRSYYRVKHNKEPSKKLELLNLISKKIVETDKEAANRLYGETSAVSGYSHLKERLKTDLLNTILFVNPEKIHQTLHAKKKLECRKLIIQSELLISRSGTKVANAILLKALLIAQKFEFPDLEIQIRDILRNKPNFDMGFDDFKVHNNRIDECIKLQRAILKTKQYYYQMQVPTQHVTNSYSSQKKHIKNSLTEIEKFIEETNSIRVKYWYYLIAISFYINIEKDLEAGIKLQIDFINLIDKEKIIYSKSAVAGGNMQLAHGYLLTNDYKKALGPALKAVDTFREDSFNYLRALEILFWVYLRTKNLEEAEKTIKKAFLHKYINRSDYFSAKWNYLKANLMFLKGDLSAAHDSLLQSDELTKDKTGWYVGFKLLLIYITFEQKNFYWLESQLENFRKLLLRNKNKSENLKRAKTIHKVAHALLKNHGDFSKVKQINQKELNLLKDAKDDMHWDPTGYEVVRFDDWFDNKI